MVSSPNSRGFVFALLYSGVAVLSLAFIGKFVYTETLPKYFSNQGPLNVEKLEDDSNSNETAGIFNNQKVPILALAPSSNRVLGDSDDKSGEEKRIEVDLTNQKLYAYEGDDLIYEFLVSTGKWGKTPIGEFRIWTKLVSTKMSGGSKELHTYYYLPKVPHTMYFSNSEVPASRGFGLHGAYWHNNFGHPMSHGCINIGLENAEKLYYWAEPKTEQGKSKRATKDNPGTKIVIYGTAPNN